MVEKKPKQVEIDYNKSEDIYHPAKKHFSAL
jgi:hypothetical protein